jgi:hypothetical protein
MCGKPCLCYCKHEKAIVCLFVVADFFHENTGDLCFIIVRENIMQRSSPMFSSLQIKHVPVWVILLDRDVYSFNFLCLLSGLYGL